MHDDVLSPLEIRDVEQDLAFLLELSKFDYFQNTYFLLILRKYLPYMHEAF